MRFIRDVLAVLSALLLLCGYFASQYAYLIQRDPASYAARLDQPSIKALTFLLFVGAIVLALIPDREVGAA